MLSLAHSFRMSALFLSFHVLPFGFSACFSAQPDNDTDRDGSSMRFRLMLPEELVKLRATHG